MSLKHENTRLIINNYNSEYLLCFRAFVANTVFFNLYLNY